MAYTEKLPSGKYRGVYRLRDGSRRSAGTFPHKRGAQKAADGAEEEANSLGWKDGHAAERAWADWVQEWWPLRDVTEATLRIEQTMLDKHLLPRWGDVPLSAITRHDIRQWAGQLKVAGLQASSVNRLLSPLRASLSAAVDAEVLVANPASRVRLEVGQKDIRRYLTTDEATALMGKLTRASDVPFVTFLFGCGVRFGEGAGLQVHRISRSGDEARIAESWVTKTHALAPYTKSRMIRDVPIPPWAAEEIRPLLRSRQSGFVFQSDREAVPDYSNFRKRFLGAAASAGLGHVTVHDTRHTYASWLLQNGIPLAEVGALLGHQDPSTTQIYAHLAPKSSEHIFNALPNVGRGAKRGENETA